MTVGEIKNQKQLAWYELPPKRWRRDPRPGHHSFRDSQKQKLYDAESIARHLMEKQNLNPSFSSIEEMQKEEIKRQLTQDLFIFHFLIGLGIEL